MSITVNWALAYASGIGPVLPVEGKLPLTRHGVKDATTDPVVIRRWWERWPDAGVAIATGAPGPTVLDGDDLDAIPPALLERLAAVPCSATARGRHWWFAGQRRGTIVLEFGELRGSGSYVVAPPSVHPSGCEYVWLLRPAGPLPPVPVMVASNDRRSGRGPHESPAEPVPHGERHPYLRDFVVRLAQAGVTDRRRLRAHLRTEFELSCAPLPPPTPGYFESLAAWAADSEIAKRERLFARLNTNQEKRGDGR